MNEANKLRVICPECGKGLRVKVPHAGKRITCPSCSSSIEIKEQDPDEGRRDSSSRTARFRWIAAVGGGTVFLLVVLLTAFWGLATADLRTARTHLAEAEGEAKELATKNEELAAALSAADRQVVKSAADVRRITTELGVAEKELKNLGAAAKDAKKLAEDIEQITTAFAAAQKDAKVANERVEELEEEAESLKKALTSITLSKLDGRWKLSFVEHGPERKQVAFVFVVSEGKYTVESDDARWALFTRGRTFTLTLNANANPKRINILNGDKVMADGIYELHGDTLLLCFGSSEGRPTEFSIGPNGPDCLVLQRQKARP